MIMIVKGVLEDGGDADKDDSSLDLLTHKKRLQRRKSKERQCSSSLHASFQSNLLIYTNGNGNGNLQRSRNHLPNISGCHLPLDDTETDLSSMPLDSSFPTYHEAEH